MNLKRKIAALALSLVFVAATVSQSFASSDADDIKSENSEKLTVYTSFFPIYDLTKQIEGDKVNVEAFMPLNQEPHDWEPSPDDVAKLSNANLLIVNGAGMEEWLDDLDKSIKVEIAEVNDEDDLILANKDEEEHDHEDEDESDKDHDHEHEGGKYDPHTWLSPVEGVKMVEKISDALAKIDEKNKEYYEKNAKKIADELNNLTKEYKEKFKKTGTDMFIVPHTAFSYLSRDFNLKQVPLTGLLTNGEPDMDSMRKVIDVIKENKIKTAFFERGGSSKAAETIAAETGVDVKPIATMEFISDDEIDNVHYQDIMKENLEMIYEAVK
ncbi:MAG: zinc ABC transporter substrate-binding protein [Peptoniphilaceae bacterium]|nr:zinc ABC transporter substrate-binding protein [Peptoniphilaceae bacterium]